MLEDGHLVLFLVGKLNTFNNYFKAEEKLKEGVGAAHKKNKKKQEKMVLPPELIFN